MKNLRCKYKTGRSKRHIEVSSTKDKVTHTYETTVVTESGEFKEKEWEDIVEKQAKELLEIHILDLLKDYSINLGWINTDEESHKYALDLYSNRIWECKDWVGYENFNKLLNVNDYVEQISFIN